MHFDWLNYHHFYYFWVVAKEGSLSAASRRLRLSHSTVSTQIKQFEEYLGEPLFLREGKGIELTEVGHLALRYADDIFQRGQEFLAVLKRQSLAAQEHLNIGVANVLPKILVHEFVHPTLVKRKDVTSRFLEASHDELMTGLVEHRYDLVLTDHALSAGSRIKAFNHVLGKTGLSFLAGKALATKLRRKFPSSLSGSDIMLPTRTSQLRLGLESWFDRHEISPLVRAEFDDTALMKVFAADGAHVIVIPTVIEAEVRKQTGTYLVGRTDEITQSFYAVTLERRIKRPLVAEIIDTALERLGASVD